MNELHQLTLRLSTARSELSPPKARSILKEVARDAKAMYSANKSSVDAIILAASAFSDLATLETNPDKRLNFRRQSINVLREAAKQHKSTSALVSYANRIVDHFYDMYAREDGPIMKGLLSDAASRLQKATNDGAVSEHGKGQLLTQRSSVLRCQALIAPHAEKTAKFGEAVRCAEKAIAEGAEVFGKLELSQALWASARWAQTDESYFAALQRAEGTLLQVRSSQQPLVHLVLARLYRQSYRPAQAVEVFSEYDKNETTNRRRLLSEAFLLGEAALQLWYNDYEATFVSSALDAAYQVLRQSIDAGYETARHFAALAFVQAALGRLDSSDITLRRLSPEHVDSWLVVITKAESMFGSDDVSAIREAFSLGLDDVWIWNALGTYATKFLSDRELALRLYGVARRLDPKNAVVLTNIARTHLRIGGRENLVTADEALRIAAACAQRSFVWWRALRDEVDLAMGSGPSRVGAPEPDARKKTAHLSFSQIQARYEVLKKEVEQGRIDAQSRGYAIQGIVTDLLKLTFWAGDPAGSHHVQKRQVDAAFTFLGVRHRVEVKWKNHLLHRDDLDSLHEILEQAEVRGVVISIVGFSPEAVEYARKMGGKRAVLLVDGNEMDHVFSGRKRFESLIEWKFMHWQRSGDPYVVWSEKMDKTDGPTKASSGHEKASDR